MLLASGKSVYCSVRETLVGETRCPVATNGGLKLKLTSNTHAQNKDNHKAWLRDWGLVALKSAKVFHLLVLPRRTRRYHEFLSARWYRALLLIHLVDKRSQKT